MNKKLIKVLSITLAIIMVFSLSACADTAYEDEEEDKLIYASDIPANKAQIIDRFNKVLAAAKEGKPAKPAISYSLHQDAGGAECENEYVKAAFKTVSKNITDNDFGMSIEYGQDSKDVFPLMGSSKPGSLSLTDVSVAYITDNEADRTYTITLKINPEDDPDQAESIFGKLYRIPSKDEVLANFDVVKHIITADTYTTKYGVGTIKAVIEKETDNLVKLELHRDAEISTEVTGHGSLKDIETVPLTFNYSSTADYSLDWIDPDAPKANDAD